MSAFLIAVCFEIMAMGGCLKEINLLQVLKLLSISVYSRDTLGHVIIQSSNDYV